MFVNGIKTTQGQPARILAEMSWPPMESYGSARCMARRPALRDWNTAVALGKVTPRYAGKARPLGEIGRVRAPPGRSLVRPRTNDGEDRPPRRGAVPAALRRHCGGSGRSDQSIRTHDIFPAFVVDRILSAAPHHEGTQSFPGRRVMRGVLDRWREMADHVTDAHHIGVAPIPGRGGYHAVN